MVVPGLIKGFQVPRLLVNFVPFFVLLVAWGVMFFLMRKSQQGKLQREIDELRAFESENQ